MRAPGFLDSTVGRKIIMALSGVILFGFVLAHMAGNLQLYLGAHALNAYSEMLHEMLHGAGLWIARGVLLLAAGLHVWAATSLTLENRAARPVGYREWQARTSTVGSRTMPVSGLVLFAFIVFHLLHLTVGSVHPSFTADVYRNVVTGFRSVPVSLFYMGAMLLLGSHLQHGVWSMLRTLGLGHPEHEPLAHRAATIFAAVIVAGNISFPLAVLLGIVR